MLSPALACSGGCHTGADAFPAVVGCLDPDTWRDRRRRSHGRLVEPVELLRLADIGEDLLQLVDLLGARVGVLVSEQTRQQAAPFGSCTRWPTCDGNHSRGCR